MRRDMIFTTFVLCCFIGLLSFLPLLAQDNPWVEVSLGSASGGGISGTGNFRWPSIATAPDKTVYVTWSNNPYWVDADFSSRQTSDVYIKRFNGTEWEEVGEGSASGRGISNNPDDDRFDGRSIVKVAPDGTPYVLWEKLGINGTNPTYLYIKRFNGTSWEEVGTGSASGTGLRSGMFPALAVGPDSKVYVAWSGGSDGVGIHVLRFNGTTWEEVGAGSASCCSGGISQGRGGSDVVIEVDENGTPYVVWSCVMDAGSTQICGLRFNGTNWEEVGSGSASFPYGISATPHSSERPSLAFGPGEVPYVAWQIATPYENWEIYVRRFNGTTWEEVGNGSASDGGISNTRLENSCFPHLIFMNDGMPYVFWKETTRYTLENDTSIWVRRFNGETWEEIFPGSASLIGIDDTENEDTATSVDSSADSTAFITYNANLGAAGHAVYVRRYEYSAPDAVPQRNYITTQPITLTWNPITWAVRYQVQVDTDSYFIEPPIDQPATEAVLRLSTLGPDIYYWRVRAIHANNTLGTWSAVESFTVGKS